MTNIIQDYNPNKVVSKNGKLYIEGKILHGRYNLVGWGKYVFFKGRLSCLDGPACYYNNSVSEYWIFGKRYKKEIYDDIVNNIPLYLWHKKFGKSHDY